MSEGARTEALRPVLQDSLPPTPPGPDLTSSAHCRKSMPGGGGPRGDPPPERLCLLCHSLQGARHGVQGRLWAPVLPAHPQQVAEIRLPVHGRLLVRGGGGETLGVRLPLLLLRPPGRAHQRTAATGNALEVRSQAVEAEEEKKKRILSIL